MNTRLFIPSKLKIGFQKRPDTYTGQLSYIIYFDNKGVLRKEASWTTWRDEKIVPQEFNNVPTEGFVINKNVGGARQSYGWNTRNEYVRVYDPRGFEFEIDIPNLLFILQESNSIKGKGLEGEFVYAWSGPNLVLLPVHCEEYKQCQTFTSLQDGKILAKSLVPGISYKTKRNETLVFMGKFKMHERKDNWSYDYGIKEIQFTNKNVFVFINEKHEFEFLSNINSLAQVASDEPISDYADRMDELSKHQWMSPPKCLIGKPTKSKLNWETGSRDFYKDDGSGSFDQYRVVIITQYVNGVNEKIGVYYKKIAKVEFTSQSFKLSQIGPTNVFHEYRSGWGYSGRDKQVMLIGTKIATAEEFDSQGFVDLFFKLESGTKVGLY